MVPTVQPEAGGPEDDAVFDPFGSECSSGFVTVVGRPNVGKSTLVNQLVGAKVAITSDRPQTTRHEIRGILDTETAQVVFCDTPGIHKPRSQLGQRTNQRAIEALEAVDVVCFVVDASERIGPGDRRVAELVTNASTPAVFVANKVDLATPAQIGECLTTAMSLGDFAAYVPVSARTGDGADALLDELLKLLPRGPRLYPVGSVTDQPELFMAAELVREQLLRVAREELPHSIAVTVEPLDDDENEARGALDRPWRIRAVIRVERDSQKGIVIGKGGEVLKAAGQGARQQLEAMLGRRVYLETLVKVDKNWQSRPDRLDRLGF